MGSRNTMDIFRQNVSDLLAQDPLASKRNLSTSIGADSSYMQKILTKDASPSLTKIDAISEFFDVNSWELFYDDSNDNKEALATIKLINRMPSPMLPVVKTYLEELLAAEEDAG